MSDLDAAVRRIVEGILAAREQPTARPVCYTVPELKALGLGSKSAIYKLMADGELVYCQTPGGRVVRAEDLDAYLMSVRAA